jgi:hypothetical protein
MKKILVAMNVFIVLSLIYITGSLAQRGMAGRGGGGWRRR